MTEREGSYQLKLPGGSSLNFNSVESLALAQGLFATGKDYPVELDDLCQFVWGESSSVVSPDVFKTNIVEVIKQLKSSGRNLRVQDQDGKSFLWLDDTNDDLRRIDIGDEEVSDRGELVIPKEKQVVKIDPDTIIDRIQGSLTEMDIDRLRQIAELEPQRYYEEVQNFLAKIEDYQTGNLPNPTHFEVLEAKTYDQKTALVRGQLEALCAKFVLDPNSMRSVQRWGRELNQMMTFSGGGDIGKQVVYEAISGLGDIEKSVLLSQMSMTKRYEIMMVGLDQVDEREMAFFLNTAVYEFGRTDDCDDIAYILETIENRDNLQGFSSRAVIEAIIQYYKGPGYIFHKIHEAARLGDFWELSQGFFATHEDTAKLNSRTFEHEESDIIPYRKRIV